MDKSGKEIKTHPVYAHKVKKKQVKKWTLHNDYYFFRVLGTLEHYECSKSWALNTNNVYLRPLSYSLVPDDSVRGPVLHHRFGLKDLGFSGLCCALWHGLASTHPEGASVSSGMLKLPRPLVASLHHPIAHCLLHLGLWNDVMWNYEFGPWFDRYRTRWLTHINSLTYMCSCIWGA